MTQTIYETSENNFLFTKEDYQVSIENDYKPIQQYEVIEKSILKTQNNNKKTENQNLITLLEQREVSLKYQFINYTENTYLNKVKLLRDLKISSEVKKVDKIIIEDNQNKKQDEPKESNETETENQNKLQNIEQKFEIEKNELTSEIQSISNNLKTLENNIEQKENEFNLAEFQLNQLNENIILLNTENLNLISSLENKLIALENIENKAKEEEDNKEAELLEEKYQTLKSNWNQYSTQVNFQINTIKEEIESKKKEYNFKYDKINQLKKEIDELGTKINQKSELKKFLLEEFEKIHTEINRNKFVNKINDLTKSLNIEKQQWNKYLNEIKQLEVELGQTVEVIKRLDNEFEDRLFQDAKTHSSLKDLYSTFIKLREGYNKIQINMIDTQVVKDKIRESDYKLDIFKLKLKNYDLKQLKDQVDMLKLENK